MVFRDWGSAWEVDQGNLQRSQAEEEVPGHWQGLLQAYSQQEWKAVLLLVIGTAGLSLAASQRLAASDRPTVRQHKFQRRGALENRFAEQGGVTG